MEKLEASTGYHKIVGMLDTHHNQYEVDFMIKNKMTLSQNVHDPILIRSQTEEFWGKRARLVWSVTLK